MAAQLLLQHVKTPSGACAPKTILVDAGRIVRIAPDLPPSLADTRLDAEGHMAAPGFVNAHIHPAQTFVGGRGSTTTMRIRSRGGRRRKPNTSPSTAA